MASTTQKGESGKQNLNFNCATMENFSFANSLFSDAFAEECCSFKCFKGAQFFIDFSIECVYAIIHEQCLNGA